MERFAGRSVPGAVVSLALFPELFVLWHVKDLIPEGEK
jgi:hypothetical protein